MKYYSERKICKCGFDTFSKKAWLSHLKEHGQVQLEL